MADHNLITPQQGDVCQGAVIRILPEGIFVDIGAEVEGIVPRKELEHFESGSANLKVGDEVLAYVVAPKDEKGFIVLSLERAQQEKSWHTAQELLESQEISESVVTGWNRGGLIVDFDGIDGFVPISRATSFLRRTGGRSIEERLARMVGERIPLKVLEVNRSRNQLVLSAQAVERQWRQQRKERLLATLQVGDVVEGTVRNLTEFGAFVDLGGVDGLVHLSEMTWGHITHPGEVLQVGDKVSVYVMSVDQARGRIALSLKKLQPDPWDQIEKKYTVGQLVESTVTDLVDFGAFVLVEEGVTGLIHISELSALPPNHPRDIVKVGETVLLRITSIDAKRHRISLSIKQVDPFERIEWEREHGQALIEVEEQQEPSAQVVAQGPVTDSGKAIPLIQDTQPKVAVESLSISDQIVQEMEEFLVLDTVMDLNSLLESDLDRCKLKSLKGLEFDYSQPSERLSEKLYEKSADKRLEWRIQAILSLQAATVLDYLGYSLSNRQMREYLFTYCRIQGYGYFTEKQYDSACTYYIEALRLLPGEGFYEGNTTSDLILRLLKTFAYAHSALMQATDLRSFFLTAAASKEPALMSCVALGLINLATVNFSHIKQILEEGHLKPESEQDFFERLIESFEQILKQNNQEIDPGTDLMTLLQKTVTYRNHLSDELETLLSVLIANSYELNRLHLLESTFADIRSISSSILCPTDRKMLEHVHQVYENLMKYIAQERFVDKETYYVEAIKQIREVHSNIQKTPTHHGKVSLSELLAVWNTTLSIEFYLEAILTKSEYLDRMDKLGQTLEKVEKLKQRIYDPTDQEIVDRLQSIYRGLLEYSNYESTKEKIRSYAGLKKQLEVARESTLAKRTYLGVQYFLSILTQWQSTLESDYQSFLVRTVRNQKGDRRKWTSSDEELLRANYEASSDLELAAYLRRTEASVAAKMRQMKLERKSKLLTEEGEDLWRNPYIVGPPVKSLDMFFGRQDIFDYVRTNLIGPYQHNTIVLHGRRRTGKSSILYQIQRRDLLQPYITVLIDAQGLGRLTMPLLFYKMSSLVSKTLQRSGLSISSLPEPESARDTFWRDPFWRFAEFLDDVEHATDGQKLILMIDEFEKIQDEIKHGRLDIDLYDNFRHLIQHREDIGFILSGTMRMVDIVKDYTSPFFGSSLMRRISFLKEDEAVALIRKPIEKHISYDDQSVERILALTGGHPYFVQLTCQTLVNHLTYLKRNVVNLEDVDYVLEDILSAGEGQFIFEWTSDTSAINRLMLSWLASRIESAGEEYPIAEAEKAFDHVLKHPTLVDATTVLDAFDRLAENEIVNVRQGRVSFRVDLYRRWIEQNKDLGRVLKEERVNESLLK